MCDEKLCRLDCTDGGDSGGVGWVRSGGARGCGGRVKYEPSAEEADVVDAVSAEIAGGRRCVPTLPAPAEAVEATEEELRAERRLAEEAALPGR